MTINQVASQLHSLSVAGYFNGERFTKERLANQIAAWFRGTDKHSIVMEIALPDGRWLFTINRYADCADGYDYTIPETRAQEARIKATICG